METMAQDLSRMQRTPLTDEHVAALRTRAQEVSFGERELVIDVGERQETFYYLLEGEIEVEDPFTGERALPAALGPGQFSGDIGLLSGAGAVAPLRTSAPTRALAVERGDLLALMATIPEMSDIIITVYAARRRRLIEARDITLAFIGLEGSRDLARAASFADRNRIPYRTVALGSAEGNAILSACKLPHDEPAVVLGRDKVLADTTPAGLASALGLDLPSQRACDVDVLIVGGGPAGVAAAVYAGAEGLSALVVDGLAIGGQAGASSRIENYMGFPTGISGGDLVWRGEVQAMKFGTRFAVPRRAVGLACDSDGRFCVTLDDGCTVRASALVVAAGVEYRRLPFERLDEFEHAGVFYAATDMEARYCRDRPVAVVGGGNSAGQAAMYLSRNASHVDVLVRGSSLASSMSSYLSQRLEADPRITVHFRTEVMGLEGGERLEAIRVEADGTERTMACGGLFVMVGAAPNTEWLQDHVALDEKGFVLTGEAAGSASPYATSVPGIFAVGDVRASSVKRVAAAVGEGSVVISHVFAHIEEMRNNTAQEEPA